MVQSWAEGDWKNTVGKQCLSSFWLIRHPRFHMLLQSSVWLHKKCRRWIRLNFCTNWTHSSAVSRGLEIDALLSSLDQVLFPAPPPIPSSPYSQSAAEIGAKEWLHLHFLAQGQADGITGHSQDFLAVLSPLPKMQTQRGNSVMAVMAGRGNCCWLLQDLVSLLEALSLFSVL